MLQLNEPRSQAEHKRRKMSVKAGTKSTTSALRDDATAEHDHDSSLPGSHCQEVSVSDIDMATREARCRSILLQNAQILRQNKQFSSRMQR